MYMYMEESGNQTTYLVTTQTPLHTRLHLYHYIRVELEYTNIPLAMTTCVQTEENYLLSR